MTFNPCEKEQKCLDDIQTKMARIEQEYPKVKTGFAAKLEDGKETPGISSAEGKAFLEYIQLRDELPIAMQKLFKCKKENRPALG